MTLVVLLFFGAMLLDLLKVDMVWLALLSSGNLPERPLWVGDFTLFLRLNANNLK